MRVGDNNKHGSFLSFESKKGMEGSLQVHIHSHFCPRGDQTGKRDKFQSRPAGQPEQLPALLSEHI